ncbi:MAG: serine hydrolase [Candidatus Aminicenantia bacterium]
MIKSKKVFLIFPLLFFSILSFPICAEIERNLEKIEDFIENQMKSDRIPGIAVAILKNNFEWAKGYGFSDIENKIRFSQNSCFRLGSVSKPMTALAILQLYEKGKINLDDEVQKYVPYFPKKEYPVIIRDLLGHLAGISHYRSYEELHIREPKDTREAIDIFAPFDLVAEPRTRFHYSSYGYNLLGAVVEGASKTSFERYMEENIWKPLGMTESCMDSPYKLIPARVKGYRFVKGNLLNSEFVDTSSRFAAGGIRSTVIDLIKLIKGIRDGKLISSKTVDMMFTSMITKTGELTNYGMGWYVRPVGGHFLVYHTGAQQETRTFIGFLPRKNIAVAFGCNLEGANPSLYGFHVLKILLDESFNTGFYAENPEDEILINALSVIFNYGMSYYERYGRAYTEDRKELKEAFNYLKKIFEQKKPELALEKIIKGPNPSNKEAFTKIGSFAGEILKRKFGMEKINSFYKNGFLLMFSEYVKISKDENLPQELRFPEEIENKIIEFSYDCSATINDFTRNLYIGAFSNIDEIGKRLKEIFKGRKVYPDFTPQLTNAIRTLYLSGDEKKALKFAKLSTELYPESAFSWVFLGNVYLASGNIQSAKNNYKIATRKIVGRSAVKPSSFINYCMDFFDNGQIDRAEALAKIGIELYPLEERLFKTLGDIYLEKAGEFYKRSLQLNPSYEDAWKILKKLHLQE